MRISEIFLLENLSINVPYHRLTMTIVCLRGFIDSWSTNFDGLQDSSDGMICTYYKKFPNIAGPSTTNSPIRAWNIYESSPFSRKKFLSLCSIVKTTEWNGLIKIDN
jgi:hypothetical protein